MLATDYTRALSAQAVRLVLKYLPRAYRNGGWGGGVCLYGWLSVWV